MSEYRYTHGHHETVLRSHRWRTAENSVAYLLPHLRPGMRLLDVGCGPGTITMDLAERVGPTGAVTALERTPEALELARAEAERRGAAGVEFVVADAHDLGLAAGSYDVVHAHQVLHHVADPVAVLREMRRVARPGGLVAVRETDYAAYAWYPELPGLEAWRDLFRRLARANGGEPDAGRRLLSWARAAGFDDVTPSASVWCYATPADREFWGGMWAERIVDSALARQAVEDGAATRAELEAMSAAWRAWVAAEDGCFLVPHGEVLARA